ncbi:hypothetical protein EI94DRAFT_1811145 [Lactarius quietus]|nr:hypothetical protein EI94DRAFT_1811145 [Lactarius quietus]
MSTLQDASASSIPALTSLASAQWPLKAGSWLREPTGKPEVLDAQGMGTAPWVVYMQPSSMHLTSTVLLFVVGIQVDTLQINLFILAYYVHSAADALHNTFKAMLVWAVHQSMNMPIKNPLP